MPDRLNGPLDRTAKSSRTRGGAVAVTNAEADTAPDVLQDDEMREVAHQANRIATSITSVILGKEEVIRACVVALLAGGHVIVEDFPGVGKTLLAKSLARSIDCRFTRVQFTPDLLPSDVTGISVFNQKTGEFEFRAGPIFANIVLADEINRASPKTQSSLLECMEERQATIDNVTHPIAPPFMVLATQNPIEYEGTYPLPESQLDRFMMRLSMGYPSPEAEEDIISEQTSRDPLSALKPVVDGADVLAMTQRGHTRTCRSGSAPLRGRHPDGHPRSSATSTWARAPGPASPLPERPKPWPFCADATSSSPRTSRTWPCAASPTASCSPPTPKCTG